MAYDIYGNDLRRGYCEVHPHVAESYPCSVCFSEMRQDDFNKNLHAQYEKEMRESYEKVMQKHYQEMEAQEMAIECCLPGIS